MEMFQLIADRIAAGEAFVLATVVKTEGSSPRQAAARMLVSPDRSIRGTIGGGMFEKMVIDDCLKLLASADHHMLKSYRFAESGPDATGMRCGGEAQVFLERIEASPRLIIFGGGHIAKDLSRIALGLRFRITVVDDRRDILAAYPPPIGTVLTDEDYQANFPQVDENCYVVIVTRGHRCDQSVLARVIVHDCAYIGMIGSKAKIAKTFEELEASGVSRERIGKVHSPIGLDIGAEGPYEIAVAIAAELIACRSSRCPDTRHGRAGME